MGVPKHTTFVSDDGVFKIVIQTSNSSNGQIEADYEAQSSPVGPLSITNAKGGWMWVYSKEAGREGVAPFVINFSAAQRPQGRPYAIVDKWNGTYKTDDSMVLTGSRAYVNEQGTLMSIGLGTKTFSEMEAWGSDAI